MQFAWAQACRKGARKALEKKRCPAGHSYRNMAPRASEHNKHNCKDRLKPYHYYAFETSPTLKQCKRPMLWQAPHLSSLNNRSKYDGPKKLLGTQPSPRRKTLPSTLGPQMDIFPCWARKWPSPRSKYLMQRNNHCLHVRQKMESTWSFFKNIDVFDLFL